LSWWGFQSVQGDGVFDAPAWGSVAAGGVAAGAALGGAGA
jgi:hypothetical protein